jgi:lipopolysaccharide/colanic/teichoic acid biosynthesis glycosyltransferase
MSTVLESPSARTITVPFIFAGHEHDETWAETMARARRRQARMDFWCRALNVAVALAAIVLALPLMLLVALAVRLSSPGPVLYSQIRVGVDRRGPYTGGGDSRRRVDYGGRLFRVYKFRTMHASDSPAAQVWASPDDRRVTRVGRFLRQYRLDELPQLWNVLRGDMNFVGPRPEQPDIVLKLNEQIGGYVSRHRVLPGITGWAQVNQHYDQCLEDVRRKLRFDLEYIENRSPLMDLRIMARTLPVVVFRKGAW